MAFYAKFKGWGFPRSATCCKDTESTVAYVLVRISNSTETACLWGPWRPRIGTIMLNINLTSLDWPIDESYLSGKKIYCLGVCGKILASMGVSQKPYVATYLPLSIPASCHQLSLKVAVDLWWIVSVIKMWQNVANGPQMSSMFYRQIYCHRSPKG